MEEKNRLVLASGSPRRLELLRGAGLEPEVLAADVAELADGLPPARLAEENARLKAEAVARLRPQAVVLAADTVVALLDNDKWQIFGKPRDKAEAIKMLAALSGREHSVFTGVAIARGEELRSQAAESRVRFRELTAAETAAYVDSGEPMDKAGAYGIQGGAAAFVESVEGDLDNIIGLPMQVVKQLMSDLQK